MAKVQGKESRRDEEENERTCTFETQCVAERKEKRKVSVKEVRNETSKKLELATQTQASNEKKTARKQKGERKLKQLFLFR